MARGGAQNSRLRRSDSLSLAAVENIIAAASFAWAIGLPLNRFTTIHWQHAGVDDPLAATGRFLKLAGDWLRSRGGGFAYVWVREGGVTKGEHVHILLHVPASLARSFGHRQRGWLKACGGTWLRGIVRSRPVGRSIHHADRHTMFGEPYEQHLAAGIGYLVKGADHYVSETRGLKRRAFGGILTGKRCGTSANTGAAARAGHKRRGVSGNIGSAARTPGAVNSRPSQNRKPVRVARD